MENVSTSRLKVKLKDSRKISDEFFRHKSNVKLNVIRPLSTLSITKDKTSQMPGAYRLSIQSVHPVITN